VIELLGWVATALFCLSYLVPARSLLAVQIVAAVLWVGYGALTHAAPVVVSNCIVVTAAGFSLWRRNQASARNRASNASSAS
jgi:hypothetical protein